MIHLVIDGQPIPKGRPRMTRTGHVYTPQRTRDYEIKIRDIAISAMGTEEPLGGALVMFVNAYLRIPSSWPAGRKYDAIHYIEQPCSRPDLDNFIKTALDACNGIVYVDDSQVIGIEAHKFYSEEPRLEIVVGPTDIGEAPTP